MCQQSLILLLSLYALWPSPLLWSQTVTPKIRVDVSLVQLNVAVTDRKGSYVTGLPGRDFVVLEDNIQQKVATIAEGNVPATLAPTDDQAKAQSVDADANMAVANIFILLDKSNYMYRTFAFALDAIADFVRSLSSSSPVAFYTYSRDLTRNTPLTTDRAELLRSIRATPAGDDAALYNALVLTLKDASRVSGKKVVVVFSNGPDNASMLAPEDASELAQSQGVTIYLISTRDAMIDPASAAVFERISAATGGKAYFAKTWKSEQKAFESIRQDLDHLYFLSYYPQASPNRGWRTILVKVAGREKEYHVRTRNGYRPQPGN